MNNTKRTLKSIRIIPFFFLFFLLGITSIYAGPCDSLPECETYLRNNGLSVIRCGCEYQYSSCYCATSDNRCTRARYCRLTGDCSGTLSTTYQYCADSSCSPACAPSCTSGCTPSCPTGTSGTITTFGYLTRTCVDGCGVTNSRRCYCTSACTPQACPAGTSTTGGFGFYRTYSCTNVCNQTTNRSCYCTSACTPQACPAGTSTTGTFGFYQSYSCTNMCNRTTTNSCYCTSGCTPSSCPPDLSNTNLGFGTSTYSESCTNSCGTGNSAACYCRDCALPVPGGTTLTNTGKQSTDPTYTSTSCSRGTGCPNKTAPLYCTRCTPATCASQSLATSNQGYGSRVLSCNNTLSSCGTESSTCYCYQCTPQVCPSPLLASQPAVTPNMLLDDFTTCTNTCNVANFRDCFESPTAQPTGQLQVIPDEINKYGFRSTTHSGIPVPLQYNLNDPVKMTATFTDSEGASDIEGVFIWFRDIALAGQIATPVTISTTGSTFNSQSNSSWGFMMRRESPTGWYAYVTDFSSGVWRKTVMLPNGSGEGYFMIPSPTGQNMVKVTLIEPILENGNVLTMRFSLAFSGDGVVAEVAQVRYNTYTLGLDRFSFTPFDNYTFSVAGYWSANQLRYRTSPTPAQTYARDWVNASLPWTIDKQSPAITSFTLSNEGQTVVAQWSVSDDKNLYTVVGNVFTSAIGDDIKSLTLTTPTAGVVVNSPFFPGTENADDIGKFTATDPWAFKVGNEINGTLHQGRVNINIEDTRAGVLIVHLTVFDDAGNKDTQRRTFDLGDWIVTDGGLIYSKDGTSFSVRNFTEDELPSIRNAWRPNPTVPAQYGIIPALQNRTILSTESLEPSMADFSSEMWADNLGFSSDPVQLAKSQVSGSYNIKQFAGHGEDNYYNSLMIGYLTRKEFLNSQTGRYFIEVPLAYDAELNESVASNKLNTICSNYQYCVLMAPGNLRVTGLNCTHKAVFFVGGNLQINPDIDVSWGNYNSKGCIFVVNGSVEILPGTSKSGASLRNDIIQSFVLANGDITIQRDRLDPSSIQDGLYINGGIQTLGRYYIYRYLRLTERLVFPLLSVDHHSKYGAIAGVIFGNTFTLQKSQVGIK